MSGGSTVGVAKSKPTNEWPAYLNKDVLSVIHNDLKFNSMTPVQSVVVPIFVNQHKDVVVEAITGSGKTLAFVVPILEILLKRHKVEKFKKHHVGALIISPTRELAQQTFDVIKMFLSTAITTLKGILFVGGNSITKDIKDFLANGGNIVVGTAGRLEDLLTRQHMTTSFKTYFKNLEVLILDEADRLLDMGFKDSLESILRVLPKQRRTGLFSATQTDEIDKLIRAGLRNPCNIQVKQKASLQLAQKTPLGLKNFYLVLEPEHKFHKLVEFIRNKKSQKHLIFVSTCACVQYITNLLKHFFPDYPVVALHRKLKEKRTKIYDQFKKCEKGVLVCTDILSRGIDIDDVDWVIQYDAPKEPNSFVHRCGRTARQGREGNALIFLLPNEDAYVNFLAINQHVPLEDYSQVEALSSDSDKSVKVIQAWAAKEREIYEKGKQAFVSFIRAYSKHECAHIFRIRELDLVKLALGFGLLHMPKMPELRQRNLADVKPFVMMDMSKIPYKNKAKEKLRLENRDKIRKVRRIKSVTNKPWSDKTEKKLKKKIKVDKKALAEKKRKNDELDANDLLEIENDFKLLKKFKKNKKSENDIKIDGDE